MRPVSRRDFLAAAPVGLVAAGTVLLPRPASAEVDPEKVFKISLAQWSLHRAFRAKGEGRLDPLKFPAISAKDFGINAVEYVNQFYKDKKDSDAYVRDLKKVADDNKVTSVLIMCDGEGALGDPDDKKRNQAVENHKRWLEWAKMLECHSIRVNAASDWKKGFKETQNLAADGLRKLCEVGEKFGINVIVENHGGLSSHGGWLAGVMKQVDNKRCGTLPDFGNFRVGKIEGVKEENYDRYKGVDELMPFAKGVSAKSHNFNAKGEETATDYRRMLDIVVNKHMYHGFVGIEYEGGELSEADGIKATKKLLETVRAEMAKR